MKIIKLANGEALELNINFLTLKLIMESKVLKDEDTQDPLEQIKVAGKLIWAIMYSNGKKVTEEDALALIPIGDDKETEEVFFILLEEFKARAEQFKKKMETKAQLNQIAK
jgi:hypothetical protein